MIADVSPSALYEKAIDLLSSVEQGRKYVLCKVVHLTIGNPVKNLGIADIDPGIYEIAECLTGFWLFKEPVDHTIRIHVAYPVLERVVDAYQPDGDDSIVCLVEPA